METINILATHKEQLKVKGPKNFKKVSKEVHQLAMNLLFKKKTTKNIKAQTYYNCTRWI